MDDNSLIKKRIIQILENNFENLHIATIKIKEFVNRMNINTMFLIKLITINNNNNNIKKIKNNSINFKDYLSLPLPLHIIHFIKNCYDNQIEIPITLTLTNYNNLLKEKDYMLERNTKQIILLWKERKKNTYDLLSIITTNLNEINIRQLNCFIFRISGENDIEIKKSWEKFNTISFEELFKNKQLFTFRQCLIKLLT